MHGTIVEERPLGGIESAIVYLAEALEALGHEAFVFTPLDNPRLSSPLYLPHRALNDLEEIDVLIAVREWRPVLLPIKRAQTFFWTGDAWDQPQSLGLGDSRVIRRVDRFLAVSEWARRTTCQLSGFPLEKSAVLRNGVKLELFAEPEVRTPKRLMYSSTPYRGLNLLPALYAELKRRHPDAELHIFSGYDVYAMPGQQWDHRQLEQFQELTTIFRQLPGCEVHGNVRQADLAKEFLRSSLLVYPNTFAETSCITAMEAQAAGCPIVTSRLAGLPETVGEAGILIPGEPGSPEYMQKFIEACDSVLSDQTLWQRLSTAARQQAQSCGWDSRARELISLIEQGAPRLQC